MSVRMTFLSIFGVTLAAFGLLVMTLHTSIADFSSVQERSASTAEDQVLCLDLTIYVGRYVKETLDSFTDEVPDQRALAELKTTSLRRLDALQDRLLETDGARDGVLSPHHKRGAAHLRKVRASLEQIFRQAEAGTSSRGGRTDEAREHLEDMLESSYDRDFLVAIDEFIKEERDEARASVVTGREVAKSVKLTSTFEVAAALVVLLLLVGTRLRMMDRSIHTLVDGAERLAAGDFSERIPTLDRHELGQIGTAFNRMAEKLEAAQSAKIRSERLAAVGQAAASIGHDLRNPLGAIRNAVHYLKRRVGETELGANARVEQFFGVVEKELDTSSKIIGNLLDFARERKLTVSACPLRPLIDDAISVVQPPRPTVIENQVSEDLPTPSLDKDQLRQALVNLVQNATEAIPPEREGRVVLRAEAAGGAVMLSIEDNGSGIPEGARALLFEPFFTTKVKGTGLGLAIAAGIIRRHKGEINVESEPGQSTTFLIRLPLESENESGAAKSAGSPSNVDGGAQ